MAKQHKPQKPRRKRWVRILRGIGWTFAAILILLVAGIAGGFAWLRSDGGRAFVVTQIQGALGPDLKLEMSALEGPIPSALHIDSLTLSDPQGPFLTARNVDVALDLKELLARRVKIETLGAAELSVARAPVLPPAPAQPATQPSGGLLPSLPVEIALDRLYVDRLALGAALLQQPDGAVLDVDGRATLLAGGNGVDANLAIDRIDGPGGQVRVAATLDPDAQALKLDIAAAEPENGVVAGLLNLPGRPALGLRVWGDGSLTGWTGRIEAREAQRVLLGGDLTLASPAEGPMTGEVALGFDGTLAPGAHVPADYNGLVGAEVPLSLRVKAALAEQRITIEKFSMTPAIGAVDVTGRVDLAARTVLADAFLRLGAPTPDLQALVAPLNWQALEARARIDGPFTAPAVGLEASINRPDVQDIAAQSVDLTASLRMTEAGTWPVQARLLVAEPAGLPSQAETLLGRRVTVSLQGALDAAAGRLEDIEGILDAADLEARIAGAAGGDALALDWRLLRFSLPDLVSATGEGRLSGPPAGADITAALRVVPSPALNVPVSPLEVTASTSLAGEQAVNLRVTGTAWAAPLLLAATILQQAANPPEEQLLIRLTEARLAGLRADGDLVLPPGATYPQGTVNLTLDGALPAGVPGNGNLSGRLVVPAPRLPVTGTAEKAPDAPENAAPAQGADPLSAALVLSGPRLAVGGQELTGLSLDVSVAMPPDGRIVALLQTLGLSVQGNDIRLRQPLTVTVDNGAVSTGQIDVAVGPGTLSGSIARAADGKMTGRIATSAIPLDELPNMPDGLQGALTVTADLAVADNGSPRWTVEANIPSLRVPGAEVIRLDPQPISVTANWNGERLEAAVDAGRGNTTFEAEAGFALPNSGGLPAPDMNAALTGRMGGRLDLALLMPIVAISGDRVAGRADIAGTLSGTLSAPQALGSATLVDVGYWRPALGLAVTRGRGTVRFTGDALVVENVRFMTPGGGTITLRGRSALAGPVDLALILDRARLVDSDLGNATISANLSMNGTTEQPRIGGTVTVDESIIYVPERLASSIPNLNVRERNGPPSPPPIPARRTVPQTETDTRGPGGVDPALNVTVRIGRPLRVEGRGLDATVGGQLAIRGTASRPLPDGSFSLQRGTFTLLGRELEFDRGNVRFQPDTGLVPVLDFRAGLTENSITVYVTVTGTPDRLSLELSSEPELPQDEILSRLLFGRETSELTPLESIQLASAAADFAGLGGPSDLLGEAQGFFGLTDFLENGDALGDKVSIDVKQGASPLDTRVEVDIEVFENVDVNTSVGATGGGGVGIGYEVDY